MADTFHSHPEGGFRGMQGARCLQNAGARTFGQDSPCILGEGLFKEPFYNGAHVLHASHPRNQMQVDSAPAFDGAVPRNREI